MGIKPRFTQAEIKKLIDNKIRVFNESVLSKFKAIGISAVKNAITSGDYHDVSGNLRSSIGCIVGNNGSIVTSYFPKAGKGTDGQTGLSKGMALASSILLNYPVGIVLILVVGEDYAAQVESRGKNVITASALSAKAAINKAITQINREFNRI